MCLQSFARHMDDTLFASRHVFLSWDFHMARECSNLPSSFDNTSIINFYIRQRYSWKHLSRISRFVRSQIPAWKKGGRNATRDTHWDICLVSAPRDESNILALNFDIFPNWKIYDYINFEIANRNFLKKRTSVDWTIFDNDKLRERKTRT